VSATQSSQESAAAQCSSHHRSVRHIITFITARWHQNQLNSAAEIIQAVRWRACVWLRASEPHAWAGAPTWAGCLKTCSSVSCLLDLIARSLSVLCYYAHTMCMFAVVLYTAVVLPVCCRWLVKVPRRLCSQTSWTSARCGMGLTSMCDSRSMSLSWPGPLLH
jgi:hypothetical protein